MSQQTVVRSICAAAALAVVATATVLVQPSDKRTYFTFSSPIAIPGVTLPAGKYLFRIADTSSRNAVQVLSEDGTKPYAMFFALRAERSEPARDPEIRFMETATGMPQAVQTWWYPGERHGYEFVYPKQQARLLAKGTGQRVLTTQAETATPPETRTAELARIAATGQEAAVKPEATPAAPVGPSVIGEIAPPTLAIPETQQARAELPKTASPIPLIALVGLLLLAGAVVIRRVRLVRG
jgi:LPXTG-motif cell wall-anchored protein